MSAADVTRRTVLQWLAGATGAAVTSLPAVAGAAPAAAPAVVPPLGSRAALRALPAKWFFENTTGDFWPAFDIFQWMDWHLPEAVMDRARRGLAEDIGPEQLAGLERRRRDLQYIEIHLASDAVASDPSVLHPNSEPAESLVTVHHWGPDHGHVRTFLDVLGLGHDRTAVQVIDLTTKRSQWATGDEYVTGMPLMEAPDIRGWLVARGDLPPSPESPGASDAPSPG